MYSRHGMLLCNMLFKGVHGHAFSETFRKKWFPEFSRIYDNHFLSLIIIYKLKVLLVQNGLMSSRLPPVTSFLWQPCCELFSWIWNYKMKYFPCCCSPMWGNSQMSIFTREGLECDAWLWSFGSRFSVKSRQAGSETSWSLELPGRVLLEVWTSWSSQKLFCRSIKSCELKDTCRFDSLFWVMVFMEWERHKKILL